MRWFRIERQFEWVFVRVADQVEEGEGHGVVHLMGPRAAEPNARLTVESPISELLEILEKVR